MKVKISYKIINPDYSQKAANDYNFGKEGESNWKYSFGVTYEEKSVKAVEFIENGIFRLTGIVGKETPIDIPIPGVAIFRCHLENDSLVDYAVSKSILSKTHIAKNEKYKITRCYFYINQTPPSCRLGENLFINVAEIPEELKKLE